MKIYKRLHNLLDNNSCFDDADVLKVKNCRSHCDSGLSVSESVIRKQRGHLIADFSEKIYFKIVT